MFSIPRSTVFVLLAAPAAAGVLPELPDVAPLAALIDRPSGDCNAAERFLEAEETYRRDELRKPTEQRTPLPPDHPAMKLVLAGLECRRCEFPYSVDLTLPPTEHPIPMSAVYWAASAGLVERAGMLQREGRTAESRKELGRVVHLGLLLIEDPGMTFIQQLIALRVLSQGAEGLGDLAITDGDEDVAATCARFLARTHAYRDDMRALVGGELAYPPLLADPGSQGAQVRKVAPLFDATANKAVQLEVLVYLGFARALVDEPAARDAAGATLERARRSPDRRIRKLGDWGLGLEEGEARRILGEAVGWPEVLE
ncbi:MAG: hypothetical protein LJF30_10805 [Acidobacteria bacterium]|nr:hypothetical protein [Acidobacteriota bacterium]